MKVATEESGLANVEGWIDVVGDVTFRSVVIPLSRDDAGAILRWQNQPSSSSSSPVTVEPVIAEMEAKIEAAIRSLKAGAAFVRLSTLSPKDATKFKSKEVCEHLKNSLSTLGPLPDLSVSPSLAVIELNRAIYRACRVTTGAEAMLMFKRSERVQKHLQHQLEVIPPTDPWKINFVVREWQELYPEYEFRAFIYNRKMTALSHYYKFCFVPGVVANKEQIKSRILEFFNGVVCERVPFDTYVADFAYNPHTNAVWLVELNPWCPGTSPALFDWSEESRVLSGNTAFEFRVLEKEDPGAFNKLSLHWQCVINECYPSHSSPSTSTTTSTKKDDGNNCCLILEFGSGVLYDVLQWSEWELVQTLDLPTAIVGELIRKCALKEAPPLTKIAEIVAASPRFKFIPTNIAPVDVVLHGGIPACSITEIVGPAGVGKTQFAHMLTATTILPPELGGLGSSVIYFDAEGTLSPTRLSEIIKEMKPELALDDTSFRELLNRVILYHPTTADGFMEQLGKLDDTIVDNQLCWLLGQVASQLKYLSAALNVAVVLINQVTTKNDAVVPSLGVAWYYCVNHRITLQYFTPKVALSPANESRLLVIVKSPISPVCGVKYIITGRGLLAQGEVVFRINTNPQSSESEQNDDYSEQQEIIREILRASFENQALETAANQF
ncbi:DNA repair protein RAD51B [Pelomyxa schiedti]|nr:DNA repair protein RAD51B [Pelomyxa schiedti]